VRARYGSGGVLVIDKPRGPTSHDVVAKVRQTLGTREVGHAGTLDPMATGVLVVLVGEATKLAPYLTADDKEYEATIELGSETDTLDADGEVVRRKDVPEEIRSALSSLGPPLHPLLERALAWERARKEQVPPSFSAIHAGGERAHRRARRGEDITLEPRSVVAKKIEILRAGLAPTPWITLRVKAGKGYFVRSLGRDLAALLGTVGHLTALRRVRSGSFGTEEAVTVDAERAAMTARLLPLAIAAARALPVARLSEAGVKDARLGRPVPREGIHADPHAAALGVFAWVDAAGDLVAVGEIGENGVGRVSRGFSGK